MKSSEILKQQFIRENKDSRELSNTVIGKENIINGEIVTDGFLRIDGDIQGIIRGEGSILVGESGRVEGDIYARTVCISGKVKGNVYALDRVDILANGKVVGNIFTKKCLAEEGMCFLGKSFISSREELDKIFDNFIKDKKEIAIKDF